MIPNTPTMWAGTQEGLQRLLDTQRSFSADPGAIIQALAGSKNGGEFEGGLLRRAGDVAVLSIKGDLVNGGNAVLNWLLGRTSYQDVGNALIEAAQDPETKSILLSISSGGGDVAGLQEVTHLIGKINAEYKPVVAHTSGHMCSAAYWLGCSASQVYGTATAVVGSIGTMTTHVDLSKANEDEGAKVTVLSSGEYKALGNQFEPLSDLARSEIQERINESARIFTQSVADNRGMPFEVVNSSLGQGRVFLAGKAHELGLLDGVSSFQDVVEKMQGGIDDGKKPHEYVRHVLTGASMTLKTLAGIPANTSVAPAPVQTAQAAPTAIAAAVAEVATAASQPQAQAPSGEATALSILTDQLVQAKTELAAARTRAEQAEASNTALQAEINALVPVLKESASRMQVALGLSADVAEMDTQALLSHHESLRGQFQAKFHANGVAAVAPAVDSGEQAAAMSAAEHARHLARIQAARLTK